MLVKFCAGILKYFYLHKNISSKNKTWLFILEFMELINISMQIMQKNWEVNGTFRN